MTVKKTSLFAAAAALAAASLAGCSKKEPADLSTPTGVMAAWEDAGLDVGAFAPAGDVKVAGGECQRGVVAELDTLLCQYSDADAAGRAEKAGLRQVGATTGLSLASGSLLLVVTDRDGKDPSGKNINRVSQVFRGQADAE